MPCSWQASCQNYREIIDWPRERETIRSHDLRRRCRSVRSVTWWFLASIARHSKINKYEWISMATREWTNEYPTRPISLGSDWWREKWRRRKYLLTSMVKRTKRNDKEIARARKRERERKKTREREKKEKNESTTTTPHVWWVGHIWCQCDKTKFSKQLTDHPQQPLCLLLSWLETFSSFCVFFSLTMEKEQIFIFSFIYKIQSISWSHKSEKLCKTIVEQCQQMIFIAMRIKMT